MAKSKDDKRQRRKAQKKEEEMEEAGVAAGVLKGLGGLIPGLKQVVEGLGKSEAFRERLKEVDEEVERRLREGGPWPERPASGMRSIPPGRIGGRIRGRVRTPTEGPPRRSIQVDLIEEGENVRVIAEVPGAVEEDIRVELAGSTLVLAVDSSREPRSGEFDLPCPCSKVLQRRYRNGVLDLLLLAGETEE